MEFRLEWHSLSCVCHRCLRSDLSAVSVSGFDSSYQRDRVDAVFGSKSHTDDELVTTMQDLLAAAGVPLPF